MCPIRAGLMMVSRQPRRRVCRLRRIPSSVASRCELTDGRDFWFIGDRLPHPTVTLRSTVYRLAPFGLQTPFVHAGCRPNTQHTVVCALTTDHTADCNPLTVRSASPPHHSPSVRLTSAVDRLYRRPEVGVAVGVLGRRRVRYRIGFGEEEHESDVALAS